MCFTFLQLRQWKMMVGVAVTVDLFGKSETKPRWSVTWPSCKVGSLAPALEVCLFRRMKNWRLTLIEPKRCWLVGSEGQAPRQSNDSEDKNLVCFSIAKQKSQDDGAKEKSRGLRGEGEQLREQVFPQPNPQVFLLQTLCAPQEGMLCGHGKSFICMRCSKDSDRSDSEESSDKSVEKPPPPTNETKANPLDIPSSSSGSSTTPVEEK